MYKASVRNLRSHLFLIIPFPFLTEKYGERRRKKKRHRFKICFILAWEGDWKRKRRRRDPEGRTRGNRIRKVAVSMDERWHGFKLRNLARIQVEKRWAVSVCWVHRDPESRRKGWVDEWIRIWAGQRVNLHVSRRLSHVKFRIQANFIQLYHTLDCSLK